MTAHAEFVPFLRSEFFHGELAERVGATPLRHIDLGHAKVAHRAIGRGPDLLFVHGWPLTAATFRNIVPQLAERFTCHLIDLPGVGASEWDARSKIDLRRHADAVVSVIRALELRQVVLVAHDSGGLFTRLAAVELPDVVRGLVLGNTEIPGHHALLLLPYLLLGKLPRAHRIMGALMGLRWFRRSGLALGACFADRSRIDGDFGRWFVQPLRRDPRVAAGQIRLLQTFDADVVAGLAQVHARITVPTHLVWGARDPFFPLAKMRGMVEQFGGPVTMKIIDDGKLFVHEEHPEAFAREIAGLAERVLDPVPVARAC